MCPKSCISLNGLASSRIFDWHPTCHWLASCTTKFQICRRNKSFNCINERYVVWKARSNMEQQESRQGLAWWPGAQPRYFNGGYFTNQTGHKTSWKETDALSLFRSRAGYIILKRSGSHIEQISAMHVLLFPARLHSAVRTGLNFSSDSC